MPKFYKVKISVPSSTDLADLTYGYAYVDDNLADGNTHTWRSNTEGISWSNDNISSMIAWVDNYIGTSWRMIPQYRYNDLETSPVTVEWLLPLLRKVIKDPKALPTVYTSSATITSSLTLGAASTSFECRVAVSGQQTSVTIARQSPLNTDLYINWNAKSLSFSFRVLNSRNIVNGKMHFSSGDVYGEGTVSFTLNSSNNWNAQINIQSLAVTNTWINGLSDNVGVSEADDDPYSGDDSDGDDGGTSNWDDESEENPLPPDPGLSAVDTGFITLFKPSVNELKNLADYLWSGAFDIATFKKIFADPMDCILGLSIVPVAIPSVGGVVSVGNISTGVSMPKCTTQYVTVNCGSVFLKESRKSYLDYAPYSKLTIFLPYCGMFDLNIDEFQSEEGTYIGVKYKVDILSGGCVAFILRGDTVVEEHAGQCSMSVPITGHDFTNTIQALCSTVSQVGGLMSAVGGGGNLTPTQVQGHAIQSVANIAGTVAAAKPTIQKSGAIASANGIISLQKPFILIERPKLSAPSYQNAYTGYPSNKTLSVGSCSGFTQFQIIHLEGIPMTDEERNELEGLMLGGIIV